MLTPMKLPKMVLPMALVFVRRPGTSAIPAPLKPVMISPLTVQPTVAIVRPLAPAPAAEPSSWIISIGDVGLRARRRPVAGLVELEPAWRVAVDVDRHR